MSEKYSINNYDDIINMTHHVSTKRPPMSMSKRAAQFAPFAALGGDSLQANEDKQETE